jgi:hypothetical protein
MGRRFRQAGAWLRRLLSLLRSLFGLRELGDARPGPVPTSAPPSPASGAAPGEGAADAPAAGAEGLDPPPSFGRKRQPVYREAAPRVPSRPDGAPSGPNGGAPSRVDDAGAPSRSGTGAPLRPGATLHGGSPAGWDGGDATWPEQAGGDPIVWLWGEVTVTKTLSGRWYRRWGDPDAPDSLARAWRACRYGEIMVVLLYETDHPAFERASRVTWPLRGYQRAVRDRLRVGGDGYADAVRAIADDPPALSAVIAALRSPKPMCPIDEFMLHFTFGNGAKLSSWAERWGAGGLEPMLAAWRAARSARAMDRLLEHAGRPGAIGPIRDAVRRELGGTLDGHPEHHCAAAIRRVVPAPPTLQSLLARRDEIVSSIAEGDP